jgi:ribosome-interacting GTPase 1
MPINADYKFVQAEQEYYNAQTDEEKLKALEEMIRTMPKHKGAESLRMNIKTRYKKLKEQIIKNKKSKKSNKKGIKKQGLQAVLVGLNNSGKSSILKAITNANPKITSYGFSTKEPEIGTMNHKGCYVQIIDLPPMFSENFEIGIVNTADTLIIVTEKISDIPRILEKITNKKAKQIIVLNKIDIYEENTKRKLKETLKSKKYNFCVTSCLTQEGLEELKEKIINSFNIIKIYTKTPGEKDKIDNVPIIMSPNVTLKDVAEKILHGYSKKVKYAKITGPSCKFPNQKIGLKHIVKDRDIVEFYTE